jgi:hypothetical protein
MYGAIPRSISRGSDRNSSYGSVDSREAVGHRGYDLFWRVLLEQAAMGPHGKDQGPRRILGFLGWLDPVSTQSMALRSVLDRHRSARHVVRPRHSMAHCAQGLVARSHRPGAPYFADSGASAGAIVVLFGPRCFSGGETEAGCALGRSGQWSSIAA